MKGVIVTARLGSSRISRKMLKSIGPHTLLEQVLLRAKFFFPNAPIILATTDKDEDDQLVAKARSAGVAAFRGDSEDVLKRHLDAAKAHSIESYLSLDGDDPFFDERAALACFCLTEVYSYVHTEGLPIGMNCSGVNVGALQKVVANKSPGNSEGWGRFFANPQLASEKITIMIEPRYDLYDFARLTMDYEEDIAFAKSLANVYESSVHSVTGVDVIRYLESNSAARQINLFRNKEYQERFNALYGNPK